MKIFRRRRKSTDRYSLLIIIAVIVFTLLIARLIYLQVFEHQSFEAKADIRSTRFIEQPAPRGKIYSANGDLLATNKEQYTLEFTETQTGMKDFYNTINTVFKLLKQNNEFSKLQDTFQLQIDPKTGKLEFNFPVSESSDPKVYDSLKIRFMYNRGLEAPIQNKIAPKNDGTFTPAQTAEVNKILLTYTPQETFDDLVKQYGLYNMLNIGKTLTPAEQTAFNNEYQKMPAAEITKILLQHYSLTEIRDFMLIKDTMKLQSYSGFKPVIIAKNIGKSVAFIFEQEASTMPGISVVETPVRYYPYGTLASHVIGYLGAIPSSEANTYEEQGYNVSNDLIGVAGIEAAEQNVLRGRTGGTMVKVNAQGQKVQTLYTIPAYPGDNVHLTINTNLEYTAQRALQQQMTFIQKTQPYGEDAKMGAVIAVNVHTGGILAMASLPGYNPNDFATGKVSQKVFNKYFNPDVAKLGQEFIDSSGIDKTLNQMFPLQPNGTREDLYDVLPKPLFNYATMGLVPPGSTFKLINSTAALETGVTDASYTIDDAPYPWYYDAQPNIFGDDLPKDNYDHGVVNIVKAIEVSCNTYFFNMAAKMYYKYNQSVSALNILAEYAAKFGMGVMPGSDQKASTGIELPENFGNTYNFDDFKKNSIFYSKWTYVADMAKGQLPGESITFVPLNVGINPKDPKDLADAKAKLLEDIDNQMEKIGFQNIRSDEAQQKFIAELQGDLQNFYNVSPSAKKSLAEAIAKDPKLTVQGDLKETAIAIDRWIVYTMYTTITTPAQLGYAAIGQGLSEYTPLQIADYAATLANGGTRYALHLVSEITSPTGQVIEKVQPEILDKVNIPPADEDLIKRGMWEVDNSIQGTSDIDFGYGYKDFPIPTAGKTGTASLIKDEHSFGRAAWGVFISYAPVKNPQIAVAVVIYNGIHGEWGAPVARAIYETYFRNEINKDYPSYRPTTSTNATYSYSLHPPLPSITDNESPAITGEGSELNASANDSDNGKGSSTQTKATTNKKAIND